MGRDGQVVSTMTDVVRTVSPAVIKQVQAHETEGKTEAGREEWERLIRQESTPALPQMSSEGFSWLYAFSCVAIEYYIFFFTV